MNIINAIYKYKPVSGWYKRKTSELRHIVVHHSAYPLNNQSNENRLNIMMGWHVKKGWPGLSYHYAIMKDGSIYQLNHDDDLTWTDSHNTYSLSILVDGYFHEPKNDHPTQQQLESLHWLAHTLQKRYSGNIKGDNWLIAHRDISRIYGTPYSACCGDILFSHLNKIKFTPLHKNKKQVKNNTKNTNNTMNWKLIRHIQASGGNAETKEKLVNSILQDNKEEFETLMKKWQNELIQEASNQQDAQDQEVKQVSNQENLKPQKYSVNKAAIDFSRANIDKASLIAAVTGIIGVINNYFDLGIDNSDITIVAGSLVVILIAGGVFRQNKK